MKSIFKNPSQPESIPIKNEIRLKSYAIISDAVTRAVSYGYRRAHKHTDTPGEEGIVQAIDDAVMNELSEIIDFE